MTFVATDGVDAMPRRLDAVFMIRMRVHASRE